MKKHARRVRGMGGLQRGANGKWIARYRDASGREVKRSTGTSDKRDAESLLAEWLRTEARISSGLEEPGLRHRADEGGRALRAHLDEYLEWFERSEKRTPMTMRVRRAVFNQSVRIMRLLLRREPLLRDLTADILERIMHHRLEREGRSARTANTQRQYLCAFALWATQEGRADLSALSKRVKRRKEDLDRRRVRRSLTVEEADRLCAGPRGVVYRLALELGLRRGELERLRWSDIDTEARTVTVRSTKTKRLETVPIATEVLARILEASRPHLAPGVDREVLQVPTARTVKRDLRDAGIEPVDPDGRVVDLHAMRSTLATRLARAGVVPQVAQRIMRHRDYRTTQRHYEHLTLIDQRKALESALATSAALQAEGTTGGAVSVPSEGTPKGTLRGTLRRANGCFGGHPEANASASDSRPIEVQVPSAIDFVRALALRCESVLNSTRQGTIGAVGQRPSAQVPITQSVTRGGVGAVHNAVHNEVHDGRIARLLAALRDLDPVALDKLT